VGISACISGNNAVTQSYASDHCIPSRRDAALQSGGCHPDGLPTGAFDGVAKVLFLTADELAAKLGVSPRTLRDQRKGRSPLP